MMRRREITIFIKLPSVPAIVVMTMVGDARQTHAQLIDSGHAARRVGTDMIVVEESSSGNLI